MFPPEPIRAFTLPRRVWTVMSAVSARLRAARTMFSPSAKRYPGEKHAAAVRIPAEAMKRRRERQCEWLAISSSCDICFFLQRSGGVVALRVKATFGRQAAGLSGGHRPPLQKSQQAGYLFSVRRTLLPLPLPKGEDEGEGFFFFACSFIPMTDPMFSTPLLDRGGEETLAASHAKYRPGWKPVCRTGPEARLPVLLRTNSN